ncbi:FOL1 [Candida theae]|uniref:Folic acid synthesis protein fol1 n=1 Tax=Candida theae TaxID=1198502 RepID=A0AAD5BDV4_9ASCO|nr:FOL1 [Candida theae]KAI5957777.1 FOL1 [Candida theae]
MSTDLVFVKDISATAITGKDAWNRPTPQPITISVYLNTDFHKASVTDNLKYSVNYAVLTRHISDFLKSNEHRNFKSLGSIAEAVSQIALDEKSGGSEIAKVVVKSPKSEIRADCVEYELVRSRVDRLTNYDAYNVTKLRLLTIIGVFTFERLQKQIVDVDLKIKITKDDPKLDFHKVVGDIVQYVESSNFKTVEALVFKIGQLTFQNHHGVGIESVDARVTKPNAFSHVEGVGVSSLMTPRNFVDVEPLTLEYSRQGNGGFNLPVENEATQGYKGKHIAYIAIGSNINQLENITKALEKLKAYDITLESTSSMYISKPMYHLDQPDFFNAAAKVSFSGYSPHKLLEILKEIEYQHLARVKEIENGPRTIDLDLLLYDNVQINTSDLIVPHKSMLERTFVLQPLCELLPPDQTHPISAEPFHDHLSQLLRDKPDDHVQTDSSLLQLVPVPRISTKDNVMRFDQVNYKSPTLIMGILNMTPDSFSDGGKYYSSSLDNIVGEAARLVQQGAQIIDIGGVSTRPGSVEPSEEEEIERVLPLVQKIRESRDAALANILISIDTYRSNVARKCLEAGADIINDISMGRYDERIFQVVAEYGCPYIMNHSRGTPQTMSKLTKYEPNKNDDIVEYLIDPKSGQQENVNNPELSNFLNGVSRELSLQILKSFKYGVKKWQIILDPGVGFAKSLKQNLAIVANSSYFKKYSIQVNLQDKEGRDTSIQTQSSSYLSFNGMSVLIGTSRKKFLGTVTGKLNTPSDRAMATAATVTSSIQQHADFVRVHDVDKCKDVVITSDAIYKDVF